MIRMSGFQPDVEIKIEFTGLRPGEKLFEELFVDDEHTLPTIHPKLRVAKARAVEEGFGEKIDGLIASPVGITLDEVKNLLSGLVPEYKPSDVEKKEKESDLDLMIKEKKNLTTSTEQHVALSLARESECGENGDLLK